jgi:hypothetical protein
MRRRTISFQISEGKFTDGGEVVQNGLHLVREDGLPFEQPTPMTVFVRKDGTFSLDMFEGATDRLEITFVPGDGKKSHL